MEEEIITISKKIFDSLMDDSLFLECLQGAGVDNWGGYDFAYEAYEEAKNDGR